MIATASVVAGDANTIATEHSYLMMCVLAGGSMSAHSKFAQECDVACGQYHILYIKVIIVTRILKLCNKNASFLYV